MFRPNQLNSLSSHGFFASTSVADALSKQPLGYIDVGARGGVHPLVEPLADITAVLAFEPDLDECNRLSELETPFAHFEIEPIAISTGQKASLHILKRQINNSLLTPNLEFANRYSVDGFKLESVQQVDTQSLDRAIIEYKFDKIPFGELLKLDVQGAELDILKGATKVLRERTVAAVIEVEFCELYINQPQFSEVDQFMRSQGFLFYGFMTLNYRSGQLRSLLKSKSSHWQERLIHADAVYFKDPFIQSNKFSPRGYHALFACSLLLGYYDLSAELIKHGLLPGEDDTERMMTFIHQLATDN